MYINLLMYYIYIHIPIQKVCHINNNLNILFPLYILEVYYLSAHCKYLAR